jgi:pyruvate dehydrogenase E1 component alpha subunit
VRRGDGPRFVHAKTYRLMGHTSTDAAAWRDADEVSAARKRDPLIRLAALLRERGVAADVLAEIVVKAAAEMASARADALVAPWPEAAAAYNDVQSVGAATWPK